MAQFNYRVDVSQIGEITLDIRQAYDESYETLITEFEQALEDYKLTLPQADSLRAEIDVILNQFGVDSQAKLNQYDDDAQQAIADNKTAFGLAESGRQDSYEQAEDNRNQASNQAVADWEQGADALIGTVEADEATRVTAETARKIAETDRVSSETVRKSNETTRVSNEDARKSAEVVRLASESARVDAENTRKGFYEGFESELGKKANKQQERWVTPTMLNGWVNYSEAAYSKCGYYKDTLGIVHLRGFIRYGEINKTIFSLPPGYQPEALSYFPTNAYNASGTITIASFSGNVTCTHGNNLWVTLDGISFKAHR